METEMIRPNPWMIVPFGLLLAAFAFVPLVIPRWWGRHYPKVSAILGVITLSYYLFSLRAIDRVLETAHDYVSFIALIGSLYVVSGGIHINVKGEARPATNVIFLLIGAVVANVFGTTGASMLLIRPWIRMNKYRVTAHHIIFFIFIVSNIGGCLTPIGDPPLFLGYLYGIPFWWVAEHCAAVWALGVGFLLAAFYVLDCINFARAPRKVREKETAQEQWRFEGLHNLLFLGAILASIFLPRPVFAREIIMALAAWGSYATTPRRVHEANHFNFHPLQEVVILFAAIFATMIPALDWLGGNASSLLGHDPACGVFYWGTGTLSSLLDNAPTYLSFLSATLGSFVNHDVVTQVSHMVQTGATDLSLASGAHAEHIRNTFLALQRYHSDLLQARTVTTEQIELAFLLGNVTFNRYIVAVSVGAVFFGAMTYIGNGPNFMVKSIATQQKVRMPGFATYVIRYSLPILLPLLVLVWWCFFRGSIPQ